MKMGMRKVSVRRESPSFGWLLMCAMCAIAVSACGSTTINNISSCGAGTTPVDGVCVPIDAASGDTLASGVDGSTSDPDVSTDSARDGTTTSDGADGALSASDPCPASSANINCSTSCGGPTANCSLVRCQSDLMTVFKVPYKSLPFVVRLPDKPGFDPKCPESCLERPRTAFGVLLDSDYFAEPAGLRIRVSPPWTISRNNTFTDFCPFDLLGSGSCVVFKESTPDILISTSDPNAPARNVVFDKGDSCP